MFKNKLNKNILILIFLIFISNIYQLNSNNKCKKNLCIIYFGSMFDDTISVYVNGNFKWQEYFITNENLSVCLTEKSKNIIKKFPPEIAKVKLSLFEGDEIKILSNKDKSFLKLKYKFYNDKRSLGISKRGTNWDYEFHGQRAYY
jgi:hypothetical protein